MKTKSTRVTPINARVRIPKPDVQLPSVCRLVHWYGRLSNAFDDGGPYAALVIDVGPEPTTVALKVTDRTGVDHVRSNVPYDSTGRAGTWMWPVR